MQAEVYSRCQTMLAGQVACEAGRLPDVAELPHNFQVSQEGESVLQKVLNQE